MVLPESAFPLHIWRDLVEFLFAVRPPLSLCLTAKKVIWICRTYRSNISFSRLCFLELVRPLLPPYLLQPVAASDPPLANCHFLNSTTFSEKRPSSDKTFLLSRTPAAARVSDLLRPGVSSDTLLSLPPKSPFFLTSLISQLLNFPPFRKQHECSCRTCL